MKHDTRPFSDSSRSLTTAEIMALIAKTTTKPAETSSGTDYLTRYNEQSSADMLPDEAGATALNVNVEAESTADQPDKGASALKDKDIIKNFKAVAPTAQPTTASSCDDNITLVTKPLAPAADEPTDKAVASSLRSSAEENETKPACGADDAPDHDTAQPSSGEATSDDEPSIDANDALFDPDFYKARVDLFDNGTGNNRTQYTAKLSVQITPDKDPDRPYELFVNFYSRYRDFKKLLDKHDLADNWYEALLGIFEEMKSPGATYAIKPTIGLMKERIRDGNFVDYPLLEHTAAILYQIEGSEPVIMMFYQYWEKALTLDAAFNKQMSNAPYKRGHYVDPKRAELAAPAKSKGIKRVSKADIGL